MANKKDTKLIELSARELEEMMIESKYLKAIDTFDFNITEDIRAVLRKINRKERYICLLYTTLTVLDKDVDKYSMQANQTIFRSFIEDNSFRNIEHLVKCKKILTAYYKYLDCGIITPIEDIYNKALSISYNHERIEEAYEIHNKPVLDSDRLDEYSLNLSKKYFKSLKLYLEAKISCYKLDEIKYKTIQKIKIHTAIKNNINLRVLNEIEYDTLLDYLVLNKNYIIEIFQIYHTMIDKVGVKSALNYMKKFIMPFITEAINIKDINSHSDFKALDIIDFIKKSYGLCEKSYNLKVYDQCDIKHDSYDIVKDFGKSILPDDVWNYTEEYIGLFDQYADILDEGEYPDELADEEGELKDQLVMDMNYLVKEGVHIVKINDYDSPFLQENYFSNIPEIKNLCVLDDMEGYAYDIGLICIHSENIDSFIKNNIENYDKINELLINLKELLAIYCEYNFTMSQPKIITKKSSLFPEDINSEYLIVSITTYNKMMDETLYKAHLSKKKIDVADLSTIKSLLNLNEKIKNILL